MCERVPTQAPGQIRKKRAVNVKIMRADEERECFWRTKKEIRYSLTQRRRRAIGKNKNKSGKRNERTETSSWEKIPEFGSRGPSLRPARRALFQLFSSARTVRRTRICDRRVRECVQILLINLRGCGEFKIFYM